MPLSYDKYVTASVEIEDGTMGGSTYTLNGTVLCFAYVRSHYRAVRALSLGRRNNDYLNIKDKEVDALENAGEISIDDANCVDEHGWLGCEVWDGDDDLIGVIGVRCSLTAGFGTDHLGTGRCKYHGGAEIESRVMHRLKHGATSRFLRNRVAGKLQAYLNDPDPLSLSKELATQRALLDEMMQYILDQGDPEMLAGHVPGLMRLGDMIGRQVNRIVGIENKYALNASHVIYIQAVVVEILNKYLPDPHTRELAAEELARKLGTADGRKAYASGLAQRRLAVIEA